MANSHNRLNAFERSASSVIDPAYSIDRPLPEKSNYALWSETQTTCQWVYYPKSLEAFLFDRCRREALHSCMNVSHPGTFASFETLMYARRSFHIEEISTADCEIYFCGLLHLTVNDISVVHQSANSENTKTD